MKNIKNYILIISFTFIAIIVFLIINLFMTKTTYVELNTPDRVMNDFNTLKEDIKNVKNEACRNSLNELVDNYIRGSYDGKVKLDTFYEYIDTTNILGSYKDIRENCDISVELLEKYYIANKYLTEMSLYDEIISNYFYQFELSFPDEASELYHSSIAQMAYHNLKYNEVEIIENYLKIIEEN